MTSDSEEQPLTRRRLRELRATGANPIIVPPTTDTGSTPLPRPAEPIELQDVPTGDYTLTDTGTLSRKQARRDAKLHTASVPVITGEVEEVDQLSAEDAESAQAEAEEVELVAVDVAPSDNAKDVADEDAVSQDAVHATDAQHHDADADGDDVEEAVAEPPAEEQAHDEPLEALLEIDGNVERDGEAPDDQPFEPDAQTGVVAEGFGADLLAGENSPADLPESFDALLRRESSADGSASSGSTLILTENPETSAIVAPITATGEVLVTGTFALPERLGSTGSASGAADAAEANAALVDGELPASASPMPISASAAISTIRSDEDIIAPPAPDRGSRLMVILAITAGVLAVGLAGVLLAAILSGVFQ